MKPVNPEKPVKLGAAENAAPIVHTRDDDSAWQDNADLALTCGLVAGCLLRPEADCLWTVEWPSGYAPVMELVRPSGKRFRLTVEEVTP